MNLYSAQLSPLASIIMEEFRISKSQYTSLYMSTLLPTVFFAFPCAWFVRKFGIKKCHSVCLGIGLMGLFFRTMASGYAAFYLATICIGFTNVVAATMSVSIFSRLFKQEKVGIAVGCMIASGAGGKTLAEVSTALIPSFKTLSVIDVILLSIELILWVVWVEDLSIQKPSYSFRDTIFDVLKSRYIWIAAGGLMLVFGIYTGISAHLPSIMSEKGNDSISAGIMSSFVSVGYFLGAVLLPGVMAKSRKKKYYMMILASISAAASIAAAVSDQKAVLISSVFVIGVSTGGLLPTILSIPAALLSFDYAHTQAAGSLLSTSQLIGAVFIPTYLIVPFTGERITNFLFYSAGLMCVEAILFYTLPGSKMFKKIIRERT